MSLLPRPTTRAGGRDAEAFYDNLAAELAMRGYPTPISPVRWKNVFAVPKEGRRPRLATAPRQRKWPLRKQDGRAEAALLALYGARQLT
ncbi:MAG: hypothetical protein WB611_33875 [Stellaceae bacterium]